MREGKIQAKAVILAGSPATALFPLANRYHKLALPLLNMPLLSHQLHSLKRVGVKEVAVVLGSNVNDMPGVKEKISGCCVDGPEVSCFVEDSPRGTAGALKDLEGFLGPHPFLVISANVYLDSLDLSAVLRSHGSRKDGVTVVVEEGGRAKSDLENVEVDGDGVIRRFHVLHHSKDMRRRVRSAGVYAFKPDVLGHIPETSYMDIKEQLIPELYRDGVPVRAFSAPGRIRTIDTFPDYFNLNRELLLNGLDGSSAALSGMTEVRDRVWAGRDVTISPDAYVLGPVIIGDGTVIEGGSKLIGPATIGRGCRVGRDVLVREAIMLDHVRVEDSFTVEYSLVGESCAIAGNETARNMVVLPDGSGGIGSDSVSLTHEDGMTLAMNEGDGLVVNDTSRYSRYLAIKRLIDVILSLVGLTVLLPLMGVVAAAIRLESSGSSLYIQERCGKDGRGFRMYKFRTMVRDAETLQDELATRKDVDGPMFKMYNDPRLTRVGSLLRKTSIDEVPQLWNVLRGDMSLVGPRPLVMEEMKFAPHWRDIRLKVKPGITGLWQINGRSEVNFHDWVKNDIAYVQNQSVGMDMRILLQTTKSVIMGVGAT